MLNNKKIAVLITNFNRKRLTKKCLLSLNLDKYKHDVYLLDDNSSDNSYNYLKKKFPKINLLKGNGLYYWARGTNFLWKESSKKNYDYYFILNNDVKLYPNYFNELFKTLSKQKNSIITGKIVSSKNRNKVIYGGYDLSGNIISNRKISEVFHLNGNCLLISKKIFNKLGFFDQVYHHHLAEVDYGFHARKNGIKTFTTKFFVGECLPNSINRVRKPNSNLIGRFIFLFSPLGQNPIKYFYFLKKNNSLFNSIIRTSYLILKNILPDWLYKKTELIIEKKFSDFKYNLKFKK